MPTRVHPIALFIVLASLAPAARAATAPNGIASNGLNWNGIASNGIASNGIASNGIASNGIASNGIASNGIASNGIASNGIASNGIASNGIASNGIASNGIASNGIASNGIASNGIASNGIASNGIASNGIASNGIASNGIASNGIASNGIASNGIASNGIASNGLAPGAGTNGLAALGLSSAGLASPAFEAWFARDAAYGDMVMKYLAQCALPADATLSFAHAGKTYAWTGVFDLAPAWSAGASISAAEQELVSACLAAHTNPQGKHVQISVRGYRADGSAIPVTREEAAGFTFREASYFGNLFDGSGVFVAPERDVMDPAVSTPRGCAAERGVPGACGSMGQAGMAADRCEVGADGATYGACSVNGRAFRPLQVFLSESVVTRVVQ